MPAGKPPPLGQVCSAYTSQNLLLTFDSENDSHPPQQCRSRPSHTHTEPVPGPWTPLQLCGQLHPSVTRVPRPHSHLAGGEEDLHRSAVICVPSQVLSPIPWFLLQTGAGSHLISDPCLPSHPLHLLSCCAPQKWSSSGTWGPDTDCALPDPGWGRAGRKAI